ncbi:hypothetical protein FGO68_gene17133 [Halteria grandinella]|uniref:Transmembrane protein n=1 Tax=Halteria grandinella TaxID=5974 RepID=A0A8J8NG08_HALGN|nr:hypothetical protein FGO68_gene17133 [Halteria grandinella]
MNQKQMRMCLTLSPFFEKFRCFMGQSTKFYFSHQIPIILNSNNFSQLTFSHLKMQGIIKVLLTSQDDHQKSFQSHLLQVLPNRSPQKQLIMKIFVILLVSLVTCNQGFLAQKFEALRQFYYSLTQNYDHTKSIQYFYYTKIAVCQPEEIARWDCGYYCEKHPGMIDVESFTGDYSSQAYCGYNQNENLIVLVYRSKYIINSRHSRCNQLYQ